MKDTIYRQEAIDALMEILDRPNHAEFLYTDEICRVLNQLPSAQTEIIYCKDCKYYTSVTARCEVRGYGCRLERYNFNDESVRMYGEDYCSYAERRTDE